MAAVVAAVVAAAAVVVLGSRRSSTYRIFISTFAWCGHRAPLGSLCFNIPINVSCFLSV